MKGSTFLAFTVLPFRIHLLSKNISHQSSKNLDRVAFFVFFITIGYIFFKYTSPVLYDCNKDQCLNASISIQSISQWIQPITLTLPMPFSFQDITRERIVQSMELFCKSVNNRLVLLYRDQCLQKGDLMSKDIDTTVCRFYLKRNQSESDALIYLPIKFSISVCTLETVNDVCHTICDGIYQLITETVEFSTDSGYSVKLK